MRKFSIKYFDSGGGDGLECAACGAIEFTIDWCSGLLYFKKQSKIQLNYILYLIFDCTRLKT